jgi:hypothetical protein
MANSNKIFDNIIFRKDTLFITHMQEKRGSKSPFFIQPLSIHIY